MDWQLIESDADLREMVAANADAPAVAIDTEFMRRNTFYPQVALVQLCFGPSAWLVDPLKLQDPSPLGHLLANPAIVKVLHSASEDLEVFQRWLGVLPEPLFDTQRAAAMVNRGFGLGYRALVEQICRVDLPKDETRSDWLQRPLTPAQYHYAAQDVEYLLPVWEVLQSECVAQGKAEWVLADGADAVHALAAPDTPYYPRIKSAWKLDRRQLGALARISDWRERTARDRDKPRSWIIDDQACLQLASHDPVDRGQLRARVELPPAALKRYGDELLAMLAKQRDVPDAELPSPLPPPLGASQRNRAKALKREARSIASELAMAPEVLLQSRDYEALLREADGEQAVEPLHWSGWRGQLVIKPLRELLAGQG